MRLSLLQRDLISALGHAALSIWRTGVQGAYGPLRSFPFLNPAPGRFLNGASMLCMSLVSGFVQAAEPVCYRYWFNGIPALAGQYFPNIGAANSARIAYMNANPAQGTCNTASSCWSTEYTQVSCSHTPSGTTGGTRSCNYGQQRIGRSANGVTGTCGVNYSCPYTETSTFAVQWGVDPDGCPPPPENPCLSGNRIESHGDGDVVPDTLCNSGCEYATVGVGGSIGGKWASAARMTGNMCEVPSHNSGANCITSASGTFCAPRNAEATGCGTVNGERVCLADVPAGTCMFLGESGGLVCASEVGSPPGPSAPGGGPATPDAALRLGAGGSSSTFNYYAGSTVSSSSTTVVGGSNPGGAGSGSGGGSGDGGDGTGGSAGGEFCDGGDCYGELPSSWTECAANVGACTEGYAAAARDTLVSSVPILAFISEFHDAFSTTSACPAYSMELLDQEYDLMSPVCSVVASNSALIHLVFQIGWSLGALGILLRAQS